MKYRPIKDPVLHPVVGFGIPGLILLAPLLAVLVMIGTDYDLHSALLWVVADVFGHDAVARTTSYYVLFASQYRHGFEPEPSVLTAGVLLICLWVSPSRRWRKSLYVTLVLISVQFPLWLWFLRITGLSSIDKWPPWTVSEALASHLTFELLLHIVLTTLIYLHTRSKRLLLVMLWSLLCVELFGYLTFGFQVEPFWVLRLTMLPIPVRTSMAVEPYLWHALILVFFLYWTIRERRKLRSAQNCWHCNYDLTNTDPDAPCPECGNAIPPEHPLRASVEA